MQRSLGSLGDRWRQILTLLLLLKRNRRQDGHLLWLIGIVVALLLWLQSTGTGAKEEAKERVRTLRSRKCRCLGIGTWLVLVVVVEWPVWLSFGIGSSGAVRFFFFS